ncbi:hypothetical protein NY588_01170 [Curtobacterium flaccumfaciens pv. beticola]|uniref:hypothetical protein n=1 Tax=Curtobacterium flaccumfaciens TaxID=2035 RepID=UPI00349FA978|nr:hypothetical protein [Curtobacterium flaccumfaciens pv. basellae]
MQQHRMLMAAVTAVVIGLSTLVPIQPATAAPPQQAEQQIESDGAAGSTRAIPLIPTDVSVRTTATGFTVSATPHCQLAVACLKWVRIPSMGIERRKIETAGANFEWPQGWAEGQTVTDGAVGSQACDGINCWYSYSKSTATGPITRPYTPRSITASVVRQDDSARTAQVEGRATPRAEIRLDGATVASVPESGVWSSTLTGLAPGANIRTFEQWIDGERKDQAPVSVTIVAPITGKVTATDDTARTANVEGTATPLAEIRLGGTRVAGVQADGKWSHRLTNLPVGRTTKTYEQFVNGTARGQVDVPVEISEPNDPAYISGVSGEADLRRGTTEALYAEYVAKGAFVTPNGTLEFTAPEGTTFAIGQDRQRGEYQSGGTWKEFGGDSLVSGSRSADGKTYSFALGSRKWDVAKGQHFRFAMRVEVPADLESGSSAFTGDLSGTVPGGSFDTTARVETTVTNAEFTATASFSDDVSVPVTVGGRGISGAHVQVRDGAVLAEADVLENGTWSVTLTAPDRGGVRVVTAVEQLAGAEIASVPVRIDYGAAVRITSPGDGFQLSPAFPEVRIAGIAAPGATVRLTEQGEAGWDLGSVQADGDGRWAIRTPALPHRDHVVVATAVSKGANTTTSTVSLVAG